MQSIKRIFLCGFMGAGKSFLLRKLSGTDIALVDIDEQILSRSGCRDLAEYIEDIGWERFRALEQDHLKEILNIKKSIVVSLGGGAFNENFRNLLGEDKNNITVWLDTPFEICLDRISSSKERPLAKLGEAYLRNLYLERLRDYKKCDIVLNQNEQESIKNIEDLISLMTYR